jgi:hypothetical protein
MKNVSHISWIKVKIRSLIAPGFAMSLICIPHFGFENPNKNGKVDWKQILNYLNIHLIYYFIPFNFYSALFSNLIKIWSLIAPHGLGTINFDKNISNRICQYSSIGYRTYDTPGTNNPPSRVSSALLLLLLPNTG